MAGFTKADSAAYSIPGSFAKKNLKNARSAGRKILNGLLGRNGSCWEVIIILNALPAAVFCVPLKTM